MRKPPFDPTRQTNNSHVFIKVEHGPYDVPAYAARALQDVASERRRQIEQEGWTAEHDDQHTAGEMAWAAACYALSGRQYHLLPAVRTGDQIAHETWPWALQWFKPTERRRDLVKAAALLLAEIERLDRAAGG